MQAHEITPNLRVWYYGVGYTKLPVPTTIDRHLTVSDLAKVISNELRQPPGNLALYKVSIVLLCAVRMVVYHNPHRSRPVVIRHALPIRL